MKICICWWGTFPGGGETIGDLFALDALAHSLCEYDINIVSEHNYHFTAASKIIKIENLKPNIYDVFIFVCGPLIKESIQQCTLFNKFNDKYKIAIGVSLINGYKSNFDLIISRGNNSSNYFDLSLCSPYLSRISEKLSNVERNYIGVCYRGRQRDYGTQNCKDLFVEKELNKLTENSVYSILEIETRLDKSKLSVEEIMHSFYKCKFLLTTRLHGTILSIYAKTPFISVDQILQGGKLTELEKVLNTGNIFNLNAINNKILLNKVHEIEQSAFSDKILELRTSAIQKAEFTLVKLKKILDDHRV